MMKRWSISIAMALMLCAAAMVNAAGHATHVVIVVWDGMRPDFVSEKNSPALWAMAKEGVTFRNHHSVYLSATGVNATAMATGVYPRRSGLIANREYRPEYDPRKPVAIEEPAVVRKEDEITGGKYIAVPTIAELVQRAGRTSAIAGTKGVVLFHDRSARRTSDAAKDSLMLFPGSIPLFFATNAMATFPRVGLPNDKQDSWTTRSLTESLWGHDIPAFSLLWLSEPDLTEHTFAPGSPQALAAMKSADQNLSVLLAALETKKVRAATDVFVVSDHGFSTVGTSVDLIPLLKSAGFRALTEFQDEPATGEILVVPNGGTEFFYVIGHDAEITRKLVDWLQHTEFAGVIFSRERVAGTFDLAAAAIDTDTAPDVVMAFRWTDQKNKFGAPGMIAADSERKPGMGTHATLSRFDMHNTLIATGPDFRRGAIDDLPTGNVDLAPTILQILGIKPPQMDGRILSEAMVNQPSSPKAQTEKLEASREFPHAWWRQHLQISRVDETIYLDEGNGALVPK